MAASLPSAQRLARYSERARAVLDRAAEFARGSGRSHIDGEHLLHGIVTASDGVAVLILTALRVPREQVRADVEARCGYGGAPAPGLAGLTASARRAVDFASLEALQCGESRIGTGHLLLGLLRLGSGAAVEVLTEHGATYDRARAELRRVTGDPRRPAPPADDLPVTGGRLFDSLPDDLRRYGRRVAELRAQERLAMDRRDFLTARRIHRTLRDLVARYADRVNLWAAGVDVVMMALEVEQLRLDAARLHRALGPPRRANAGASGCAS
jgi:ATP-dependent Clp protease ATP-binding subunit ClpC